MKLIAISAFYNARAHDGIRLRIQSPEWDDVGDLLEVLRAERNAVWQAAASRAATAALVVAIERQLAELRARPPSPWSKEDSFMALANIDLLERTGHLKPDEYNGLMLFQASGDL